jgi:uncharacterized membrane protein (DUF373 family)
MRGHGKQLYMKIVLILLAEALAIVLTDLVSKYIVPIKHTTLSYIVCGAFLAYVIVYIYDYVIDRRRERLRQELQAITDVTLLRYGNDTQHRN